jgi:uncharacterized protein (TIGR02246 family)
MFYAMKVLYLSLLMFVSVSVHGQTSELTLDSGVAKHVGIDEIYTKFSKAYRELDHAAFMSLYTKDAAYLVPGDNIDIGNTNITDGFKRFFDSVRSKGETLTISFQIVQRKVSGNMAYDVGIYTLRSLKDNKQIGEGKGKFVVVAMKEGKAWKFQVDGYSDLPKAIKSQ